MRINSMLALVLFPFLLHAQIAINNTGSQPHSSAMLDVSSANKGILVPNISLANVATATPVTSPAAGLVIWNSNASVTGGNGIGFYYWDGVKWQSLLSDNTGWRLGGNAGTNPSVHFIGTTDNQPLVFRVNNLHAGKIDPPMNNIFLGAGAGFSINSINAKRNSFFGDSSGHSVTTASDNSFFGYRAGRMLTVGFGNSAFGSGAASKLTTETGNSFFGHSSGRNNTGSQNSFFGYNAGLNNDGSSNSIFGSSAGVDNVTGSQNSFFGNSSGTFGTTGSQNCFFGFLAGSTNEGNRNNAFGFQAGLFNDLGHHNAFFGSYAGYQNNDGNFNVYIGDSAGYRSGGSFNTMLGARTTNGSTFGLSTVSNSTAIGYLSQVDTSNGMVLGSINGINSATTDTRVGIGTTKPKHKLHVVNTNPQDGGWTEGIVVESVTSDANVGEAGISFRNAVLADNKQWTFGLNQNPQLAFNYGSTFAAGNTRMIIDTFGNVGINVGVTAPAAKLHVNGTAIIGTNGTVVTGIIKTTVSADIDGAGGLVADQSFTITVPVPNAQPGATVFVSPEFALLLGSVIAYARVSAANTVEIKTTNTGSFSVNNGPQNLYITVIQ